MIVAGLLLAVAVHQARGQGCQANELAKLTASDAAEWDQFGISVSVSGDLAVIGALYGQDAGTDTGSAYVYRFDGTNWIEEAELTASDADPGDEFGHSVSVNGDLAVIGAHGDDDGGRSSGSAYVFQYNGSNGSWVQVAKLTASDAAADDFFGGWVSIDGDVAVIGALGDDHAGSLSGSAYVFQKPPSGWADMTETVKLTASDAEAGDIFGSRVSISGDVAVVGALYDDDACPDDPGCNSGSAYLFARDEGEADNWGQVGKLTASDAAAEDYFGKVSISGDVIVIGAGSADGAGTIDSGAAYVFVKPSGGWGVNMTETAKLTASDAEAEDVFGNYVSVSGDVALIGAGGDDDACPANPDCNSGSAYVFVRPRDGWVNMTETAKLTASDAAGGDTFSMGASAVSISGDVALIGAWGDDDAGYTSGSAYVFAGLSSDCQPNGTLDICDIAGCSPISGDCNGNGVPDDCEEDPGCLCNLDGVCDPGEDCDNCPCDCSSESSLGCGNGVCEPSLGEDCLSCPSDCNSKLNGNPNNRFCCGDGDGQNPVACGDPRCSSNGFDCSAQPVLSSCCGDGICEGTEDNDNCAVDCASCTGDCDDGVACTDDACVDGTCVNTPNNANCPDDELFCNGTESCDAGSDCISTGDPCGAGETCNEVADTCESGQCGQKNDPCTGGADCCSGMCKNNGRCR